MTDLIERLERGERWDSDNADVLRALGWRPSVYGDFWVSPDLTSGWMAMSPLDSVDAALRLVPVGWVTFNAEQYDGEWEWALSKSPAECCTGVGSTVAVALTVAILRAHEAAAVTLCPTTTIPPEVDGGEKDSA